MGNIQFNQYIVDDVAKIAIDQGQLTENTLVDATGPDTFEYKEFLDILSNAMQIRNIYIPIPDWLTLMVGQFMGLFLQDIVITEAEIRGLKQGLMASSEEPLVQPHLRPGQKKTAMI